MMKRCCKCEMEKPLDDFNQDRSKPDGRDKRCRACGQSYRLINKDKQRQRNKERYWQNREARLTANKLWRATNMERRTATNAAWRAANRDTLLPKKRAYYEANREAILQKKRDRQEFNTLYWFEHHLEWFAEKYEALPASRRKRWARLLVNRAVFHGVLVKPSCCSRCDRPTDKTVLDAHHKDYSQPLVVEWVCRQCHSDEHH